jgi:hypothetical protein
MRRLLPILAIVAAGLATWWLVRTPDVPLSVGGTSRVESDPSTPPTRVRVSPPAAPDLGTAPAGTRRKPAPGDAVPKGFGDLRVRLQAAGGAPDAGGVRIDLEAVRPTPESARLALAQADGTWLYSRVPAGRYRVLATVPGYMLAGVHTQVVPDDETIVDVTLEPGAEIVWKVVFPGEAPETVRLALHDAQGKRVAASFRTAATTVHVPADRVMALPLEGRILGLRPGRYRLRGESPAGETDEQDVLAETGKPGEVELRIRR